MKKFYPSDFHCMGGRKILAQPHVEDFTIRCLQMVFQDILQDMMTRNMVHFISGQGSFIFSKMNGLVLQYSSSFWSETHLSESCLFGDEQDGIYFKRSNSLFFTAVYKKLLRLTTRKTHNTLSSVPTPKRIYYRSPKYFSRFHLKLGQIANFSFR